MDNKVIKKKLKMYLGDNVYITKLKKTVIEGILEQEHIESYIKDVLQYGCQSGLVAGLIYYNDSEAFALKYFNDIVELYQMIADDLGENSLKNPMLDSNPLNWLAWFGYEETVREIANELELEY